MPDTQIDALASTLAEVKVTVDRIDASLRGNGSKGLFTDVALLSERIQGVEESQKETASLKKWVTLGVLAAVGSAVWQMIVMGRDAA